MARNQFELKRLSDLFLAHGFRFMQIFLLQILLQFCLLLLMMHLLLLWLLMLLMVLLWVGRRSNVQFRLFWQSSNFFLIWSTIVPLFPFLLIYFLYSPQLLLEFHPPVLEPDLDLPLGQAEGMSYLDPTPSCKVVVEMKLLFQLKCLEPCVCLATPPAWTSVRTFDNWI